MKKSIAVILLGSALLLPNNNSVEASYSDKNVQAKKVQYIECVGWEDKQFDFSNIQLKKNNHYKFQYKWQEFLSKISEGTKKAPSKPIEESEQEVTPEIEEAPEVEVVPETKPVPTPTPEVEKEPEATPVPEETPEVEKEPETKPVPEATPAPAPVEPAPEKPSTPVEEAPNASISTIEQAVLTLTNAERQKAGLAPLQSDSKLMDSARAKSKDMSAKKYFSHTSPTYGSPFDQMKTFGISYRAAAENIAMGQRSAEEVVKAWMESPGHRQNILDAKFTHIGIGYDASGNYWTQQFIQK